MRQLEDDQNNLREQLEEEEEAKRNMEKQLITTQNQVHSGDCREEGHTGHFGTVFKRVNRAVNKPSPLDSALFTVLTSPSPSPAG